MISDTRIQVPENRALYARYPRPARWLCFAVLFVVLAATAWVSTFEIIPALARGVNLTDREFLVVVYVNVGVFIGYSGYGAFRAFTLGPDWVEASPEAILLGYRDKKPIRLQLSSPGFRLSIDHVHAVGGEDSGHRPDEIVITNYSLPYVRLNIRALRAILDVSRAQGLLVESKSVPLTADRVFDHIVIHRGSSRPI